MPETFHLLRAHSDDGPQPPLRQIRADGWARLDRAVVSDVEARDLRERILAARGPGGAGWENSFNSFDTGYRDVVWDIVAEALRVRLEAIFVGFEAFNFAVLCKWPGPDGVLPWHQDWTFVDERAGARTIGIMVALEDFDESNGCVHVVPGSHRLDPMPRGTDLNYPWADHSEQLSAYDTVVALGVGEAMAWDSRTVHRSDWNRTDRPRVAIGAGLRPIGSQLVHCRRAGPASAAVHLVDEAFFRSANPYVLLEQPVDGVQVDTIHFDPEPLGAARLDSGLSGTAPGDGADQLRVDGGAR